jgi:preprotein translocase subunit SecG
MATVLIVIHLMVVLAMIALVLLQRSEGGALGIGGGGGGGISRRGSSNFLTKTTGVFAACFFATSIGLTALAKMETRPTDIFERIPGQETQITTLPQAPAGGAEAPGTGPGVLEALRGDEPAPPQEAPAAPEAPDGGLGPQQPPGPPTQ